MECLSILAVVAVDGTDQPSKTLLCLDSHIAIIVEVIVLQRSSMLIAIDIIIDKRSDVLPPVVARHVEDNRVVDL